MIEKKMSTGIDDATKCPCIGSIFIAGVTATSDTIEYWKEIGVKDSKLLTHKKIQELALIIKETAATLWIDEISPAMIDNKIFNLNEWEMLIVFKILKKLGYPTDHAVLIDNWEPTLKGFNARKQQMLHEQNVRINRKKITSMTLQAEHRADENYTVVGAASILAKNASIEQYQKYTLLYGDFGSGSPSDPKTRLFIWQHRKNPPVIVRQSWNTFKMLVNLDSIEEDPFYRPKKKL